MDGIAEGVYGGEGGGFVWGFLGVVNGVVPVKGSEVFARGVLLYGGR